VASRRDQFQAYRFLNRRYAAALLRDDSDSVEGPMRRVSGGVTASIMVGLLAVAVAGLYGVLKPGGAASWQDGKSLILERESGTRYVYLGGTLHPVLNYASARLILRGGNLVEVSQKSLADTPRGVPVGIDHAPDSLPVPSTIDSGAWSVCSAPATDQTGAVHPVVRASPAQAAGGSALTTGSAILVRGGNQDEYLVWNGRRLRISASGNAVPALGYAATQPMPVGDAWLNTLPQGPDVVAPTVPQIGAPGPTVAGHNTTVGQLFRAGDDGTAYVMYSDGLAPVTPLQLRLLQASPSTSQAYPTGAVQTTTLTPQEIAQAGRSKQNPATDSKLPNQPPAPVDTSTGPLKVCLTVTGGDETRSVSTVPAQPQPVSGGAPPPVDALGVPVADGIDLAPGHGAVIREVPAPGVTTGTTYLVTDLGVKFPLDGGSVLADLGLGGVAAQPLPSEVVRLFPTGPTLSEQAAAQTVPVIPAVGSPSPTR
jgi:type VII secretion protein EccB